MKLRRIKMSKINRIIKYNNDLKNNKYYNINTRNI